MDRRPKLFGVVFDLNQTPLSSPRETVADCGDEDVVVVEPPTLSLPRRNDAPPVAALAGAAPAVKGEGESSRDGGVGSMLCIDCQNESRPRGPRLVEEGRQWRCFRCLLKDRGSDGVGNRSGTGGGGRGGGVALLDINASPPREMEVDGVYAGPGDDVAWDRNHGHKCIQCK